MIKFAIKKGHPREMIGKCMVKPGQLRSCFSSPENTMVTQTMIFIDKRVEDIFKEGVN